MRRFEPPSLGEVTAYCEGRKNDVDPHKWYDFYTAKGWMIGKNKMVDWRAAVRTWEKRNGSTAPPKPEKKLADYSTEELQFIVRLSERHKEPPPAKVLVELAKREMRP